MLDLQVVKLDSKAVVPKYANPGDAGLDLTAITREVDDNLSIITYGTGLAFAIPKGHVGLLFPRSSVYKQDLRLANCVGVIDSGYRGEVMFKYDIKGNPRELYKTGDRVGQIVILPLSQIQVKEVEQLNTTDRGEGGFGSTGI